MNKKLEEKTNEWMNLPRTTQEERVAADDFYERELIKLIIKEFVKNNKEKKVEDVEYMIFSVGTSYEPLVLTLSLLKPKKILFLYTEKTENIIEKIVNICKLGSSRYSKSIVNETDSLEVYREIKKAYIQWEMPRKLYIDFTGGTKSMSVAAAMAGAMIEVQLVYVGTEHYLQHFRKPYPGSERICFIANPYEVFGDFEIEKAMNLFQQYDYAGASERLGLLCEKVPDPLIRQQLRFIHLLSSAYEAWDSLDFSTAYKCMCCLNSELQRDKKLYPKTVLMDQISQLQKQQLILSNLIEIPQLMIEKKNMDILKNHKYIVPLMFTMYKIADIREVQEKYDAATLMLYRLLEMIEQCRLARYEINVSKPEYTEIQYDFEQTPEYKGLNVQQCMEKYQEEVYRIRTAIFKGQSGKFLPNHIALLDGFILLMALKDRLMFSEKYAKAIDKIKHTRAMVYLRNNSIFAHGFSPVGIKEFESFKKFVLNLFEEFCEVEEIDFRQRDLEMNWISPKDSKYYTLGVKRWQ